MSVSSTSIQENKKGTWIEKDEFWAGGRFYTEVSVVESPLGIYPNEVSDIIQNDALITNATESRPKVPTLLSSSYSSRSELIEN
jgi:hypothetical protein